MVLLLCFDGINILFLYVFLKLISVFPGNLNVLKYILVRNFVFIEGQFGIVKLDDFRVMDCLIRLVFDLVVFACPYKQRNK